MLSGVERSETKRKDSPYKIHNNQFKYSFLVLAEQTTAIRYSSLVIQL